MHRPLKPRLSPSITIGNLSFTFSFPSRSWLSLFLKNYHPFFSSGRKRSSRITVRDLPAAASSRRGELSVTLNPDRWDISRPDFSSGTDFQFDETLLACEQNKYSFDSWLRVFCTLYGIDRNALLIHGAGYTLEQRGFIFPGRSGRGKSTLIRILGKDRALSDELTCLYKNRTGFRCASTPFWGELKRGSGKVFDEPLRALCFLAHGNTTYVEKLSTGSAFREVLKTVLFFAGDTRSHKKLLALAADVTTAVPSYRLVFAKYARRTGIVRLLSSL